MTYNAVSCLIAQIGLKIRKKRYVVLPKAPVLVSTGPTECLYYSVMSTDVVLDSGAEGVGSLPRSVPS